MKSLKYFVIVFLAFLISCDTQQKNSNNDGFQQRIDRIRVDNNIPGMALCIFSSDTIYEYRVSGIKRLDYYERITRESMWHLGSNTKSFIAFAAASMVEDGLITWNARFFDLFPEYKEFSKEEYFEITLQNLLQHRAGLPPNTRSFPELLLRFVDTDTILDRVTLFEWAGELSK